MQEKHSDLAGLPEKACFQLNDTHPTIAVRSTPWASMLRGAAVGVQQQRNVALDVVYLPAPSSVLPSEAPRPSLPPHPPCAPDPPARWRS